MLRYAERLALGIALEASAFPKPGNVHRLRNFSDTIYEDFIVAAIISVEPLYRGIRRGYRLYNTSENFKVLCGDMVYSMVSISMSISGGGNTCLGSSLMLAPISVALGYRLAKGDSPRAELVLSTACELLKRISTAVDTIYFYRAIRRTSPSYVRKADVVGEWPNVWSKSYRREIVEKNVRLWDVLVFSSSFDIVARDIVEGYPRVYGLSRYLGERLATHNSWNRAVVEAYLYQLSKDIDTLVVRKKGYETALYVKERAEGLLELCTNSIIF